MTKAKEKRSLAVSKQRRQCSRCGMISTPGAMAVHVRLKLKCVGAELKRVPDNTPLGLNCWLINLAAPQGRDCCFVIQSLATG